MNFIGKSTANNMSSILKKTCATLIAASTIGLPGVIYASDPTSGILVVINAIGNVVDGSPGATASSANVVVNDTTGPCSTTKLSYGGIATITWNAANVHSATKCTDIVSVDVTALKTISVVQYDSTANATPPAVATAPTNFVAPTTAITNLALIITGGASAATTGSATVWGSPLGVKPIYDTENGSLSTTGTMGSVGSAGFKAMSVMLQHGIKPMGQDLYTPQ